MICPRCNATEISPDTGKCGLCGYVPEGTVAVDAHEGTDTTDELARRELAHQFRFDVLLGQGPSSVVYLAQDLESDRRVVVKVLQRPSDRHADDRFRRTISQVATLRHPHLVAVERSGLTDSLLWYSMTSVRGKTLRATLRSGDPMALPTCLRLANQIASALDYLHRRALVHGNIKPENIIMDEDGWAHVSDAAVAAALESEPPSRATGNISRPPAYVAPEDWTDGERSPASDQYAFAVLLHECLTHAVPFSAGAPRTEPPPLAQWRRDLPSYVQFAIHRALSVKPADRFPSVLDFVATMEGGGSIQLTAKPTGRASHDILMIPGPDPARRRSKWWLAVPVLLLALFVGYKLVTPRVQPWEDAYVNPLADEPTPDTAAAITTPVVPERTPNIRRPPREQPTPAARTPERTPRAEPTPPRPQQVERRDPTPARPEPATPAPAPAGEPGILFVSSSPWGQLYIDGQLVGNTPRANIRLSPGTHTIRIVRDGFETYERTIQVASGQEVRLTGIVLTERQP